MTSYQQFSYKTKHEIVEWVAVPDEDDGGGAGGSGKGKGPVIGDPPGGCKGEKCGPPKTKKLKRLNIFKEMEKI